MDDDVELLATEPARSKRAYLDETPMVVYRCHDVWDTYPSLGITEAWSDYLGLGPALARDKYYSLHEIPTTTAWELVHRIAQALVPLKEQAVQFVGIKWHTVHRVAVGTGAITDVRRMVALGADVALATDDGTTLWRDAAWMTDLGLPLIVVNHMTSEIPGLRNLARYLGQRFPDVPVEFVGPTCSYEIFATERSRDAMIRMRRDTLEGLRSLSLPEGYVCRPMEGNESWAYVEIMNQSNYAGEVNADWFQRVFLDDPGYDPSFLQIVWRGNRPVAAAAAWHKEIDGERWGMVHWVGVVQDERGLGLGKAVTLAALHRLRERGFRHAMLDTSVWRLPAVASYFRLGFVPWPSDGAPQGVWDCVLADLEIWRDLRGADIE